MKAVLEIHDKGQVVEMPV